VTAELDHLLLLLQRSMKTLPNTHKGSFGPLGVLPDSLELVREGSSGR